jgi:hypothetical protein
MSGAIVDRGSRLRHNAPIGNSGLEVGKMAAVIYDLKNTSNARSEIFFLRSWKLLIFLICNKLQFG